MCLILGNNFLMTSYTFKCMNNKYDELVQAYFRGVFQILIDVLSKILFYGPSNRKPNMPKKKITIYSTVIFKPVVPKVWFLNQHQLEICEKFWDPNTDLPNWKLWNSGCGPQPSALTSPQACSDTY